MVCLQTRVFRKCQNVVQTAFLKTTEIHLQHATKANSVELTAGKCSLERLKLKQTSRCSDIIVPASEDNWTLLLS